MIHSLVYVPDLVRLLACCLSALLFGGVLANQTASLEICLMDWVTWAILAIVVGVITVATVVMVIAAVEMEAEEIDDLGVLSDEELFDFMSQEDPVLEAPDDEVLSDEDMTNMLLEFNVRLAEKQESLGPEFEQVLNNNLWELYEK